MEVVTGAEDAVESPGPTERDEKIRRFFFLWEMNGTYGYCMLILYGQFLWLLCGNYGYSGSSMWKTYGITC